MQFVYVVIILPCAKGNKRKREKEKYVRKDACASGKKQVTEKGLPKKE